MTMSGYFSPFLVAVYETKFKFFILKCRER